MSLKDNLFLRRLLRWDNSQIEQANTKVGLSFSPTAGLGTLLALEEMGFRRRRIDNGVDHDKGPLQANLS